ncbi:hypothetical protein [uncultured Treponema sp.]|uniref:hypothetical protein n=1 Tax=uncultured Treponema sp. TaxID=162155 RepID=UPI002604B88E|nr:hypothetical protein [uncultured Treponema sp.]
MNDVILTEILISDFQEKTARKFYFNEGINIITSSENHVGKSSLIKSIYYTLGAEVNFDDNWNKLSKIYSVKFRLGNQNYQVVRYTKKFAVLQDENLLLLTDDVSHELAKKLEEIFDFGIYLPNKNNQKVELAPPVFSYMPYYIDQDSGWSEIYNSFNNLGQYKKDDRLKSLYYHLGIYNKETIKLMSDKDIVNQELKKLESESEKIQTVIETLSSEINNIVPASNIEELERNLIISKNKIDELVKVVALKRNEIQKLEGLLQGHKFQLALIEKKEKISINEKSIKNEFLCPICGYRLNNEIFKIVEINHGLITKKYATEQISFQISKLEEDLKNKKIEYISLMKNLKKEEDLSIDDKSNYENYLTQRGLEKTINSLNIKYDNNLTQRNELGEKIKDINKELKDLPTKENVESIYKDFVIQNLLSLGAWESSYEEKIGILKPIKAQGTLLNKIILAQEVALFQTIENLDLKITKFPFVIDSPRGNEASKLSSYEILKLIINIDSLKQIIISTVDFENYCKDLNYTGKIEITFLNDKRKLLNEKMYEENTSEIESLFSLFNENRDS